MSSPKYFVEEYKKSNTLISSKYRSSLLENKILALGLSKAFEENGRIVATLSAEELRKALLSCEDKKKVSGSFYSRIKDVADEMTSRKVFIENADKTGFIIMNLIGSATYIDGKFTIKFEPDLTEYLLNVKNNYTIFSIPMLMSFKKMYSYRLYEIIKSFMYERHIANDISDSIEYSQCFGVSELKISIGAIDTTEKEVAKALKKPHPDFDYIVNDVAKDKTFKNWSNFKSKVIDPAVAEINQKTDIEVSYSLIRGGQGGQVHSIVFRARKKPCEALKVMSRETATDYANFPEEAIRAVLEYVKEPITTQNAVAFLRCARGDIELIKRAYDISNTQEEIYNFVGWMIKAITEEYEKDGLQKVAGYSCEETAMLKETFERIKRSV